MKKVLSISLALIIALSCCMMSLAADNSKPFENSEFFTYGDYTLHYRVFEPQTEAKNQIILIHGFGLSGVSFEGLCSEYVRNGYRVVLADMPNFGYSSRETAKTNLIDRETLTYMLMKSINNSSWIVGGHSMGGGIAMNIATDHPEAVSGLVLFAPQTSTEIKAPMDKIMRSAPVRGAFDIIIRLGARIDLVMKMMVEMSFSDGDFAESYDLSKISDPLKIPGTGAGMAIMASHARGTDYEKLSALSIPTIIVTSANDKVANAKNLEKTIQSAPKGTAVYEFEKGGHMMMEYAPEEAAQVTLPVMDNCSFWEI
ncbi:MAG: alpha/beta fold hydrolase [Acutalibacteraceae bacterium]